jgi:Type II restriction endonuclease EcoO109I
MTSVDSKDVNINPFLMLAMAPAYNIYSPLEAAEYAQMAKLPHGDATAFGRFVEDKVFPIFGVADPPEKRRSRSLFSPIDKEITVDGTRYLMTLKSGPWTMNQSHANEMIAGFPKIHERTGCDLIIGIFYGSKLRVNNKPGLVTRETGGYVHTLVGKELWEFVTGVRDAHLCVFAAIQEAQVLFAERHGGKTFAEHLIEARLQLAESFRSAFGVVQSGDAMWQQIFKGSF